MNRAHMSTEYFKILSGFRVPQANGLIVTAGQQIAVIRRKHNRAHFVSVPGQIGQLLARRAIPQFQVVIKTAGHYQTAVGRESHCVNVIAMPAQRLKVCTAGDVPNPCGGVAATGH